MFCQTKNFSVLQLLQIFGFRHTVDFFSITSNFGAEAECS